MPKVLILVAHRPGRSPSQRYRFEQYIPFLKQNGIEFTWSPLLNEKDDIVFYNAGHFFTKIIILLKGLLIRLKDAKQFSNYDIIFIQREALFFGTSYFERRAKQFGKKVIFDFDDAIWLADTSPGNKKWEWVKNPKKFETNVALATLVIAGNKYLAEKAQLFNKNVTIIPTTVDTIIHVPKPELRNKEKITIGWSGSISTIKHFELVVPQLLKLHQQFEGKLQFKVIGDAGYVNEALAIKGIAWNEKTEVDNLNSFDIGLMPLPNDEWANGKCGLKALTYMACGIPVVMSAVGVNTQIAVNGESAFLVNTSEEWLSSLQQLIINKSLRESMGEKGRQVVIKNYSVEANKEKYLKVFKA